MRKRYLNFKLTNREWCERRPFLPLCLSGIKNGERRAVQTLLKWTPKAYQSEYRVRLINKYTHESINYAITGVEHLDGWLIVKWDPDETVNTILSLVPTLVATGLTAGIVAQALRKEDMNESITPER